MTIEEIREATRTKMSIDTLRSKGYWKACRDGKKDFNAQTVEGLALKVEVDAEGKVVAVAYRLARMLTTKKLSQYR
jgi:hypothetical protein